MCSLISIYAAHLGDFDPELHDKTTEYITEFKFIPNQVHALKLFILFFTNATLQWNSEITRFTFGFSFSFPLFCCFFFHWDQRTGERNTEETQSSDVSVLFKEGTPKTPLNLWEGFFP